MLSKTHRNGFASVVDWSMKCWASVLHQMVRITTVEWTEFLWSHRWQWLLERIVHVKHLIFASRTNRWTWSLWRWRLRSVCNFQSNKIHFSHLDFFDQTYREFPSSGLDAYSRCSSLYFPASSSFTYRIVSGECAVALPAAFAEFFDNKASMQNDFFGGIDVWYDVIAPM